MCIHVHEETLQCQRIADLISYPVTRSDDHLFFCKCQYFGRYRSVWDWHCDCAPCRWLDATAICGDPLGFWHAATGGRMSLDNPAGAIPHNRHCCEPIFVLISCALAHPGIVNPADEPRAQDGRRRIGTREGQGLLDTRKDRIGLIHWRWKRGV